QRTHSNETIVMAAPRRWRKAWRPIGTPSTPRWRDATASRRAGDRRSRRSTAARGRSTRRRRARRARSRRRGGAGRPWCGGAPRLAVEQEPRRVHAPDADARREIALLGEHRRFEDDEIGAHREDVVEDRVERGERLVQRDDAQEAKVARAPVGGDAIELVV